MDWKRYLAEGVGTFFLVFFGTGSIIIGNQNGGASNSEVALVFGLVVMVLIFALGRISGAHFNPAVSFGFWLAGEMKAGGALRYVLAQSGGAILASSLLKILFPGATDYGATVSTSAGAGLVFEILLTGLLVLVIMNIAVGRSVTGHLAGLAVGGTIALAATVGGPVSGASMNPARSLGPALVGGVWDHFWIYLAGPVTGAAVGVFLCRLTHENKCCKQC